MPAAILIEPLIPCFDTRLEPRCVAFSPDETLLRAASGYSIRLWDLTEGLELLQLQGHEDGFLSVAFSPDAHTLASASWDNTVRVWDPATGQCLAILMSTPEGWVAWSRDGRYKYEGEIRGYFWHALHLCRFEPGKLDD